MASGYKATDFDAVLLEVFGEGNLTRESPRSAKMHGIESILLKNKIE